MLAKRACVQCSARPLCPPCAADEFCQLIAQTCNSCAKVSCVKSTFNTNSNSVAAVSATQAAIGMPTSTAVTPFTLVADANANGDNSGRTGAIAGGVVGAFIALTLICFLVWRWKKRQARSYTLREKNLDLNDSGLPAKRASTHTVASIASTTHTRASNIIPIAYVPGITNRSNQSSRNSMIPPVPPIPTPTQCTFTADDIMRASTFTTDSIRDSRSSIATTAYISPAAYTAVRAKPALVKMRATTAPGSIPMLPQKTSEVSEAHVPVTTIQERSGWDDESSIHSSSGSSGASAPSPERRQPTRAKSLYGNGRELLPQRNTVSMDAALKHHSSIV